MFRWISALMIALLLVLAIAPVAQACDPFVQVYGFGARRFAAPHCGVAPAGVVAYSYGVPLATAYAVPTVTYQTYAVRTLAVPACPPPATTVLSYGPRVFVVH